jgi:hypothetical protein
VRGCGIAPKDGVHTLVQQHEALVVLLIPVNTDKMRWLVASCPIDTRRHLLIGHMDRHHLGGCSDWVDRHRPRSYSDWVVIDDHNEIACDEMNVSFDRAATLFWPSRSYTGHRRGSGAAQKHTQTRAVATAGRAQEMPLSAAR